MENPDLLSIWQEYAKKVVDQGFIKNRLLTLVTSVMQIQKSFFSYEKKERSFFVILYPERKRRTAHAYTKTGIKNKTGVWTASLKNATG